MSDTFAALKDAPPPDLDEIEARWLRQCGHCDAGLAMSCTCPEGDPRNVIASLVDEIKRLRATPSAALKDALAAWREGWIRAEHAAQLATTQAEAGKIFDQIEDGNDALAAAYDAWVADD